MRLLFAAAELAPLAQTGGLGEAVSGLARALAERGHEIRCALPAYRSALAHPECPALEDGPEVALWTPNGVERGRWRIRQRFEPQGSSGALGVDVEIAVDKDRSVVFMPMLVVLPGAGSFGEARNQGLFPGLEYLDASDKSSSEADIIGPGSRRQVPDSAKITMPLMAIQAGDRYIALHWKQAPQFCAMFDSPDRLFRSGASVMGLLYPGSKGGNREEGSLLPYRGEILKANSPLHLHAWLLGGSGKSVVLAVKAALRFQSLPALPASGITPSQYVALAAAGYLDSKIRVGNHYSHAYPGAFRPGPAGDVAVWEGEPIELANNRIASGRTAPNMSHRSCTAR